MAEDKSRAGLERRLADIEAELEDAQREKERFLKLRYSTDLLEARLRFLRAERARCLAELGGAPAPGTWRSLKVAPRALVFGTLLALALGLAALVATSRAPRTTSPAAATPTAALPVMPAPPETAPTAAATPAWPQYGVVVAEALNVRLGPGLDFAVRRLALKGAVVVLVRRETDAAGGVWYELESGGWVAGEWLKVFPAQEEALAASKSLER